MHTLLHCYVEGAQTTPPEGAHIIEDYPYGKTLRCRKAMWIERATKGASKGEFRVVSCTTNPKRGDTWNKPHAGVYHGFAVMYVNGEPGSEHGHIKIDAIHWGQGPNDLLRFLEKWGDQLNESERKSYKLVEMVSRRYNPQSWAALSQ